MRGFFVLKNNMRARTEQEGRIVSKFGGVPMATERNIRLSVDIFLGDYRRDVMTVSAPGARYMGDIKVTDLLLESHNLAKSRNSFKEPFAQVRERFLENGKDLGVKSSFIDDLLDEIHRDIRTGTKDRVASRGEWAQAQIIGEFSGLKFVDATDVLKRDKEGNVDYAAVASALPPGEKYIVPAWYSEETKSRLLLPSKKEIVVFSGRGGSDTSGAHIARGVEAVLYETWKNVSGIKTANPLIVGEEAKEVSMMSERALRELGNKGAKVLHPDTVEGGVPVSVRNIFDPEHPGTLIVPHLPKGSKQEIVGIASKKGYVAIEVEQPGSNYHPGVGADVLSAFAREGVSYDHVITGQDSMTVLVHEDQLAGNEDALRRRIRRGQLRSADITKREGLGFVTVVGEGLVNNGERTRVARVIFDALAEEHIPTVGYGSSIDGINAFIAVDADRAERTVQVLHKALF